MAIPYFSELTEQEQELVLKAPAIVTVLIAGADDKIDKKEKEWATKLVQFRTFTSDTSLHDYYEEVEARFESDLGTLLGSWDAATAEESLTTELAQLKDIFPKTSPEVASELKESLRSLAKQVAKASGGFLGMGGVDGDEARLMKLDMLD